MTLTTEQHRILSQVRKHVSPALATEMYDFFMRGKTLDDLRDIIVTATEERKAEAAR